MAAELKLWSFGNPTRILFGTGCRSSLSDFVGTGSTLVVSSRRGRAQFEADKELAGLAEKARLHWVDDISTNPELDKLQATIDGLAQAKFDTVIAFGGGSALDAAKAIAFALAQPPSTRNLAALIADPTSASTDLPPIYALPTTAGTGAEVTPFATVWDTAKRKKLSLANPCLFPQVALVDPHLSRDMPESPTFSTGLDALNQAFESVWNRNSSPVTLAFAARAIGLGMEALPRLAKDLDDFEARTLMAEASVLAGVCISQTRTALCHSISYPLTAHFGLPHGWACAYSMRAVAELACPHIPDDLDFVARVSGAANDADGLIEKLDAMLDELKLGSYVRRYIDNTEQIEALIPEMFTPGRSDNFIAPVDTNVIKAIVQSSAF